MMHPALCRLHRFHTQKLPVATTITDPRHNTHTQPDTEEIAATVVVVVVVSLNIIVFVICTFSQTRENANSCREQQQHRKHVRKQIRANSCARPAHAYAHVRRLMFACANYICTLAAEIAEKSKQNA